MERKKAKKSISGCNKSNAIFMVRRPKVPASWERRYYEEEGSISWEQIVKAQLLIKSLDWDSKIKRCLDWDASSGDEALGKAKARFWCKLNGIPFKSLTTDEYADMNIDKDIDWNPEIDPEISLALDNRHDIVNEGANDGPSESSDDKQKWLTKDYLFHKDVPVIPISQGWGPGFVD
ncbi:hypothetical protein MKW98_000944 [Papaver atlanticum]|uniref:Uncharacterized protein n=1 Tax=Papaver atlanticum TaxID=357466 RepID=A0AAD4SEB6_9MAGN|nr:hypothetical protein MKW98_000944 [Papaver atlanticum]